MAATPKVPSSYGLGAHSASTCLLAAWQARGSPFVIYRQERLNGRMRTFSCKILSRVQIRPGYGLSYIVQRERNTAKLSASHLRWCSAVIVRWQQASLQRPVSKPRESWQRDDMKCTPSRAALAPRPGRGAHRPCWSLCQVLVILPDSRAICINPDRLGHPEEECPGEIGGPNRCLKEPWDAVSDTDRKADTSFSVTGIRATLGTLAFIQFTETG
jgi:hypothetical protein